MNSLYIKIGKSIKISEDCYARLKRLHVLYIQNCAFAYVIKVNILYAFYIRPILWKSALIFTDFSILIYNRLINLDRQNILMLIALLLCSFLVIVMIF